jgi:hypothetical protein
VSNNFQAFWNQRAADGFNVADSGALSSAYQNTIDYSFRNPLADNVALTRPTPTPHNYSFNTSSFFWSVAAIRPSGVDYDLDVFDDRAQGTFLASSTFGGGTIDFVAVDSNRRALGDYYPRARVFSGSGNYQVHLAQGVNTLGANASQGVTLGSNDVVAVRDTFINAGTTVTFKVTPGNGTQDPELFLMASDPGNAATWVKGRPSASASASAAGPGGVEQFSFTAPLSAWYGLVLTNKAGSGTYTLQRIN